MAQPPIFGSLGLDYSSSTFGWRYIGIMSSRVSHYKSWSRKKKKERNPKHWWHFGVSDWKLSGLSLFLADTYAFKISCWLMIPSSSSHKLFLFFSMESLVKENSVFPLNIWCTCLLLLLAYAIVCLYVSHTRWRDHECRHSVGVFCIINQVLCTVLCTYKVFNMCWMTFNSLLVSLLVPLLSTK